MHESEPEIPRILMVEDDEDIARLIRLIVETHGFKIEHAKDGRQAIDHIENLSPPHLVLMDIMLPDYSGLGLVDRLRARPAWKYVPVLVLTAKASQADIMRALDSGINGYIVKPFQHEDLLARICRLIRTP